MAAVGLASIGVVILRVGFGRSECSFSGDDLEEGMQDWDAGGDDDDVCFDAVELISPGIQIFSSNKRWRNGKTYLVQITSGTVPSITLSVSVVHSLSSEYQGQGFGLQVESLWSASPLICAHFAIAHAAASVPRPSVMHSAIFFRVDICSLKRTKLG